MSDRRTKRVARRIYPRVAPHLAERLAKRAAAAGISVNAVVEAALEQYLDRTGDATLLLARLDRLGRTQERLHRDLKLHAEAFAAYVRMWFAQTPTLPPEARKAAIEAAEARFGQFLQYVAQQAARGAGFFDQLPRESVADERELADSDGEGTRR